MPQPAVLDSRGLRGLAHPMRVQILDLLDLDGPATATMLADSLGVRSGSTSWHLLKLAEVGLIVEVPQPRGRRGRWWCSSGPWGIDHADCEDDGELADASSVVLGAVVSQHLLRATQFLNEDWPERWRRAWILTLLRQRDFGLLWVGGLVSYLGSWAMFTALPVFVYERTGSALASALTFTATVAPMLLSSVAGVFVDRWNRKNTLVMAVIAMGVLTCSLLLAGPTRTWLVYVSMFCVSLAGLVVSHDRERVGAHSGQTRPVGGGQRAERTERTERQPVPRAAPI